MGSRRGATRCPIFASAKKSPVAHSSEKSRANQTDILTLRQIARTTKYSGACNSYVIAR